MFPFCLHEAKLAEAVNLNMFGTDSISIFIKPVINTQFSFFGRIKLVRTKNQIIV